MDCALLQLSSMLRFSHKLFWYGNPCPGCTWVGFLGSVSKFLVVPVPGWVPGLLGR